MITLPIASFVWVLRDDRILTGITEMSSLPEMKRIERKILVKGERESIELNMIERILDAHEEEVIGWVFFGQLAQGREVRVTIFND